LSEVAEGEVSSVYKETISLNAFESLFDVEEIQYLGDLKIETNFGPLLLNWWKP
jgi:hypothetical protein